MLVSALSLAACGGGDDDPGPVAAPGTGPTSPDTDPDAAPPGGAPDGGLDGAVFFRTDQVTIDDGAGNLTQIVDSYDDSLGAIAVQERFNGDVPAETRRFEYDDEARLVARTDFLGQTDEVFRTVEFSYANDALAVLEFRDADGVANRRLTYEFGADGLVESSNLVVLANEDGTPVEGGALLVERRTYDYAAGRLASESVDDLGDGTVDRTRDYAYLPDGRLETVTVNDAVAGTTEVETWRYETGSCTLAWANSLFGHFCVPIEEAG